MKKFLYAICIIAVCFFISSCNDAEIKTNGEIKPKVADGSPHWQKLVSDNEIKIGVSSLNNSFDNELIDAFSKELDIPVKKVVVNSKNGFGELLVDDEIDMYWGLYPKEAADSFDYTCSSPYLTTTALILLPSNMNEDLNKKEMTVGVLALSAEAFLAEKNYKSIKTYNSENELLYALVSGAVDCVMINNRKFENTTYFNSDAIRTADAMMYNLVVAFREDYGDIANEVDKTLAKIKASGVASEICEKWYGADLISK